MRVQLIGGPRGGEYIDLPLPLRPYFMVADVEGWRAGGPLRQGSYLRSRAAVVMGDVEPGDTVYRWTGWQ